MMSEKDAVKGKILVSVAVVIEGEENKILLMREGDLPYHKYWVIPGGYVNPDETVKQTLVREGREETGLEILPAKFVGIYDDFFSENDEPIHHIIIAYEAIVIGGRIIITKEATEYAWMDSEEVLNSPQVPDIFKRIIDDFKKQKPTKRASRLKKFLTAHLALTKQFDPREEGTKNESRI
ncbi:MAG: NUDIX hydrolase [Candidatus Bathyarchaeota archaeon]|nr:NUDIX hydrolase [Candidatus Bathyarchaeota archaeon]